MRQAITILLTPLCYSALWDTVLHQWQALQSSHTYKSKSQSYDTPAFSELLMIVTIAETRLAEPGTVVFTKKGRKVRLTLAQALTLRWYYSLRTTHYDAPPEYWLLLSVLDKALVDYYPWYGNPEPNQKSQLPLP